MNLAPTTTALVRFGSTALREFGPTALAETGSRALQEVAQPEPYPHGSVPADIDTTAFDSTALQQSGMNTGVILLTLAFLLFTGILLSNLLRRSENQEQRRQQRIAIVEQNETSEAHVDAVAPPQEAQHLIHAVHALELPYRAEQREEDLLRAGLGPMPALLVGAFIAPYAGLMPPRVQLNAVAFRDAEIGVGLDDPLLNHPQQQPPEEAGVVPAPFIYAAG